MRTLLFLLAFALVARAQMHPSLPELGTLDGLGVNIHFTEPQLGELEMIRAAGFRWVRMDFTWAATEPEPGRYDFAKYDSLVAALEKAGLRDVFDAISVHLYRQGASKSVAEEYRALRVLIRDVRQTASPGLRTTLTKRTP